MKATTYIHGAIRNIGDSTHEGEYFEGSVRDFVLWLASQIASMTMQSRIVIGIGRDRSGAAKGIALKRAAGSGTLNGIELSDELDRLLAGESLEEVQQAIAADPKNPLDDWKGI